MGRIWKGEKRAHGNLPDGGPQKVKLNHQKLKIKKLDIVSLFFYKWMDTIRILPWWHLLNPWISDERGQVINAEVVPSLMPIHSRFPSCPFGGQWRHWVSWAEPSPRTRVTVRMQSPALTSRTPSDFACIPNRCIITQVEGRRVFLVVESERYDVIFYRQSSNFFPWTLSKKIIEFPPTCCALFLNPCHLSRSTISFGAAL